MWSRLAVRVLLVLVLGLLSVGLACGSGDSGSLSVTGVDEEEISADSATIVWTTSKNASGQIEYGVSNSYGSKSQLDANMAKSHSVVLNNLTPSTTYYYKVISVDSDGNEVESSGSSFRTSMQFTITGSQLVSDNGTAALRILLTTSAPVSLALTNPDGLETGTDSVEAGVTTADLAMAEQYETPKAGRYTLTVQNALDSVLTRDFDFAGANASITQVTLNWVHWSLPTLHQLQSLSIKLNNAGDLPACVGDSEFFLDGKTFTLSASQVLLPGETKTFSVPTSVSGVTEGPKQFSLTLKDSQGAVVATYSATVYPP